MLQRCCAGWEPSSACFVPAGCTLCACWVHACPCSRGARASPSPHIRRMYILENTAELLEGLSVQPGDVLALARDRDGGLMVMAWQGLGVPPKASAGAWSWWLPDRGLLSGMKTPE